jgi:hypothetical protein
VSEETPQSIAQVETVHASELLARGMLRDYALARFPAEQWQVFIIAPREGGRWTVLAELPPEDFARERDVDGLPAALSLCEEWALQIELDEESFMAADRSDEE